MNLLVDPETMTITGVVDFELSHVGLISDEFMNGLGYVGHIHPNLYDPDEQQHSAALLSPKTGFADWAPVEGDGAAWTNWATARAFEHAFAEKSVPRPRTIPGFENSSKLYWFCQDICQ
jgi:aminoglycoside phosphotransferase (APT) family kinase protein